jgi:hypothetical protein
MKTTNKIRKTENQKRMQKSLLLVLILAISILPTYSQCKDSLDVQGDLVLQKGNLAETAEWSSEIEYCANKFAETEIALEIQIRESKAQTIRIEPKLTESEIRISNEKFLDEAETYTAEGCNREITKYAQALLQLQEQKTEIQSYATVLPD